MNLDRPLRPLLLGMLCLAITTGCANNSSWTLPGNPFASRDLSPEAKRKRAAAHNMLEKPAHTHIAYARLQESWGNLADARSSYELALGEDPESTEATIGLARIDQLAGRATEAEQGYLKALRAKPNDPAVLDALGQFYASEEKWSDSLRYLNEATQAAPDDMTYRYHLAVAYARSGNIEGARPHFAQAVGHAAAHYNIGYILFEQDRLDAAEHELRQAVVMQPQLAEAQQMLDEVIASREDRMLLVGSGHDVRHSRTDSPRTDSARTGFSGRNAGTRRDRNEVTPAANWQTGHSAFGGR